MHDNIRDLMKGDGNRARMAAATRAIDAGHLKCMAVCTVKGEQAEWTNMPQLKKMIETNRRDCNLRERCAAVKLLLVCLGDWQKRMQDANKDLTDRERQDLDRETTRLLKELKALDMTGKIQEDVTDVLTKELSDQFKMKCANGGICFQCIYDTIGHGTETQETQER